MSIDVVSWCPKHGSTGGGIGATIKFGKRRFCAICLSDKLAEFGVSEIEMKRIDRDLVSRGPFVKCESCGGDRPQAQDACPICGHQAPPDL
jgi:hypothetical protein